MKLNSLLTTVAAVMLASCTADIIDVPRDLTDENTDNGTAEVLIGLPAAITRTEVGDNGSARWSEGDTFALWAVQDGEEAQKPVVFALENKAFTMWHYSEDYSEAFFTTTMEALPQGTYTYYATSPLPQSCNGTTAVYTLPSEQSGSHILRNDIMAATPLTAEALAQGRNRFDLQFKHLMHAVKFTIPQNGNLLERELTAITLTFPTDVAGTVSIDITNPDAKPVLTNGSNTVTVRFDEPKKAGDSFWLNIFPTEIKGDITYMAEAGEYKSVENSFAMSKLCEAGHITPISLKIPRLDATTRIRFRIGDNFLGEQISSFKVVDANGKEHFKFDYRSDNVYEYVYQGEMSGSPEYSGKTLTAVFDSPHATVQQQFAMPDIAPYTETDIAPLRVPYVLEEDFSQAKGSEHNGTYTASANNESTLTGYLLNDVMTTAGWNAARYMLSAGQCIRLNVRYQSGAWVVARYCGRLDTPALTCLKGSNVKLKVEFDAAAYTPAGYNINDTSNSVTYLQCGVHTDSVSSKTDGVSQDNISKNCTVAYTSPYFANTCDENSFGETFNSYSFTVDGCSNASRIVWWPSTTQSNRAIAANCCYFVYIDNIKISIAQ